MDKIANIVYMNKKTLQKHDISFKFVVDEKHAMQVAKKLRPRYHKILSVSVSMVVELDRKAIE